MWRGFRDCGEALTAIGGPAATLGKAMSTEAPPLLAQLRKSMAMDAGPPTSKPRCFPYVAGIKECGCAPSPSLKSLIAIHTWLLRPRALISETLRSQDDQGRGVEPRLRALAHLC